MADESVTTCADGLTAPSPPADTPPIRTIRRRLGHRAGSGRFLDDIAGPYASIESDANVHDTVSVAETMAPLLDAALGRDLPVRFEFWDSSGLGPRGDETIRFTSPTALNRILWAPNELGLARAFVTGDVEIDGSLDLVLKKLANAAPGPVSVASSLKHLLTAARRTGAVTRPPRRLSEELVTVGRRHSIRRDKRSVRHHYDVGNDFYELVLGSSMTYSCARFTTRETSLAEAQAAKHELICRKLGLAEHAFRTACTGRRPRLLDVGCGWGTMLLHAARHHDVDAVGVTLSREQADLARQRVAEAGLRDRIEIRVQDYREVDDGPFDAISSIGMAEHVGSVNIGSYFGHLAELLRPGGRLLNHAIASVGGSRIASNTFVGRFVFPDGELIDLADTIRHMQHADLEVRDVENLREHYAQTLRAWVANLTENWDAAVQLVGARRARIWLLYMSGSINGFDDAGLRVYQTLGVRSDGRPTDLPPTRSGWA